MKRVILLTGFMFSAFCILPSCSKHKDVVQAAPAFSPTMAMEGTVNGGAWNASSRNASVNEYTLGHELVVNGWQQSTDETVYLVIRPYDYSAGTFYLGTGQGSSAFYRKGTATQDNAKSGKIVIYSVDADTIKGTYDFTTVSNLAISGKFTMVPIK